MPRRRPSEANENDDLTSALVLIVYFVVLMSLLGGYWFYSRKQRYNRLIAEGGHIADEALPLEEGRRAQLRGQLHQRGQRRVQLRNRRRMRNLENAAGDADNEDEINDLPGRAQPDQEQIDEDKRKKQEAYREKLRLRREQKQKEREAEEAVQCKEKQDAKANAEEERKWNAQDEEKLVALIRTQKVCKVVALGKHFQLKPEQVLAKLKRAEQHGRLFGIIDDRGNYVYFQEAELDQLALHVKQQGRIQLADFAKTVNEMVDFKPTP